MTPIKEAVSEEFERAFSSHSSGCRLTCNCGITHFDTENRWDWEEGELLSLQEHAQTSPNEYQSQPNAIGTYILYDKEIVMGCPCNFGRAYEDFIIKHARQIAEYLNSRAKRIADEVAATKVTL